MKDKKNQDTQAEVKPKAEYRLTCDREGDAGFDLKATTLKQAKSLRTQMQAAGFTVKVYLTKEIP